MNHETYDKALTVWQEGPDVKEDYHSSTGLISNSFVGNFIKCEYSAVIEYSRVLKPKDEFKECFAVGHITEAYVFEGQPGFIKMTERYKENIYQKNGNLYKWVADCKVYGDAIIKKKAFRDLLRSEGSQYHKTYLFSMFGLDWKAEIDYLNLIKRAEVDLKTTRSEFSNRSWNPKARLKNFTFIDEWNYHRQRAVYQKAIKIIDDVDVKPHILAVCKSNNSVRLFEFDDQSRLDYELKQLEPVADRIKKVLSGEESPEMCEECEHCVRDEKIDYAISVSTYCAPFIN